jgi:hypothetical protein
MRDSRVPRARIAAAVALLAVVLLPTVAGAHPLGPTRPDAHRLAGDRRPSGRGRHHYPAGNGA